MSERYKPVELTNDVSGAVVKNFKPLEGSNKDRFRNRLFVSKDLAYLGGIGEKVKAGILISPKGQKFIAENPGILKGIDRALALLEISEKNEQVIDIDNNWALYPNRTGGQSKFYLLVGFGEQYAIKTHAPYMANRKEIHQPYMNEMLQTQELGEYLNKECPELRVKMSSFLFASGQVSCTKFEENTGDESMLDVDRLKKLQFNSEFYIDNQRRNLKNELWDNVEVDLFIGGPLGYLNMFTNFIKKSDGSIVWIDPFIYNREG